MACSRLLPAAWVVLAIARASVADDSVVMHLPPGIRALMPDAPLDARQMRALVQAEQQGKMALPAPVLLLLADAETRRGNWYDARRLFAKVVESNPSDEWGNFGRAGLGWLSLVRGDIEAAHAYYAEGGAGGDLGRILLALTDAAEGSASAAETLRRLAAEVVDPDLRQVARIGWGYAHYWAGNFTAAASAFAVVRDGVFADDAEYGGALARWQLGEREAALERWDSLAARAGGGPSPRSISRGLLRLEPRYVFRAGLQRYSRLPPAAHEAQLVAMLDADGAAMAASALRLFDPSRRRPVESLAGPIGVAARAPGGEEHAGAVTAASARGSGPLREGKAASARARPLAAPRVVSAVLALLAVLVGALLWRRRSQPGSP